MDSKETVWQRTIKDTISYFSTIRFWLFDAIIIGIATFIVLICPPKYAEDWQNIMYQVTVPILSGIIGLLLVFILSLILAPYRQRNDARNEINNLQNKISELTTPKLAVNLMSPQLSGTIYNRVFYTLRVNNPTSQPIINCYGKLLEFKTSNNTELRLPMSGLNYPWTSHGSTGEQLCNIGANSSEILDILVFQGDGKIYTPVLSIDSKNRNLLFPLPPGIYDIKIQIGSQTMAVAPKIISLRCNFIDRENPESEQKVEIYEIQS